MIQENYPAWPAQLRERIAAEHGNSDTRAIDLASAVNVAVSSFLDGFEVPATERAALATEALAIFLVQSADQLPKDAPFITRLEWLLTRISQRSWALQLARKISVEAAPGSSVIADAPPRDGDVARRRGFAVDQNPFRPGSDRHATWADDWNFRDRYQRARDGGAMSAAEARRVVALAPVEMPSDVEPRIADQDFG